jgi:RNA polymerase sigma-70 factor (ECF subfamily)
MRGTDLEIFEAQRPHLLALAYRMLGELARAEDLVQEAWLRWSGRDHSEEVVSPRAYLATSVTRLCLSELSSARHRREESRGDRLPEPIDLAPHGIDRVEALERVSMAFLVALQRLTPAERAVLLLHDVFDFEHAEIAQLVGKSDAACRKLLERAKGSLAEEKRLLVVSRASHERLLTAFLAAAYAGDANALVSLLAEDATIITDGGAAGRVQGDFKNLAAPLKGAMHVAAFVVSATRRGGGALKAEIRDLNGLPAVVLRGPTGPFGAITLAVADERIHRVYFHADLARLDHVGGA